jgi:hypothetical protein
MTYIRDMNKKYLILQLLLLVIFTSTPFAAETREPKIVLKDALAKAEKYISDQKINVSDQFLFSIYRSSFPDSKNNCWTII